MYLLEGKCKKYEAGLIQGKQVKWLKYLMITSSG